MSLLCQTILLHSAHTSPHARQVVTGDFFELVDVGHSQRNNGDTKRLGHEKSEEMRKKRDGVNKSGQQKSLYFIAAAADKSFLLSLLPGGP